jgi:hypothetical protein
MKIKELFNTQRRQKEGLNVLTANSVDNVFIPLSALTSGTLYKLEEKRLLLYSVVYATSRYDMIQYNATRGRNSSNIFFHDLKNLYALTHSTTEPILGTRYYANDHLVYTYANNVARVLMVLTIEKKFLFEAGKDYKDLATNKNIVLLYDTILDTEQHKWAKQKLVKFYLSQLKELDINILKTPDIHHWAFNNYMPNIPTFKTIRERREYLSTNTKIIFDGQLT